MAIECFTPPKSAPLIEVRLGQALLANTADVEGWAPTREIGTWAFGVYSLENYGVRIGDLKIWYDYQERSIYLENIHLTPAMRNKGIGREIYTAIPFLPLPCGHGFADENFTFYTDIHSPLAENLWQSLVRRGMAAETIKGGNSYQMLPNIPPPSNIEITVIDQTKRPSSPTGKFWPLA